MPRLMEMMEMCCMLSDPSAQSILDINQIWAYAPKKKRCGVKTEPASHGKGTRAGTPLGPPHTAASASGASEPQKKTTVPHGSSSTQAQKKRSPQRRGKTQARKQTMLPSPHGRREVQQVPQQLQLSHPCGLVLGSRVLLK